MTILNPYAALQVTRLPSDPRSIQRNERPMRLSGEHLQSSKFENQDRQLATESGKHSSDGCLQSNEPEGQ
jgi:hypothetical protein